MKTLVINCGSSSLKYQLIDMATEDCMVQGLVERIGIEGSILTQKVEGKDKYVINSDIKDHKEAIRLVLEALVDPVHGVIKSMDEISAVGHRVVHGGEKYSDSVLINDEVLQSIKDCIVLAPLHNPPNVIGIEACKELMPNTPMVAVFDTAFHQTMPKHAYICPLPYELYEKYGVRKYGFHGTSHKYVSNKVAEAMGKDIKDLKIITCHLGNGCSLAAVKNGKSIDTSMGFTPLAGVMMGTRSGSIDPSVISFLIEQHGYTIEEIDELLNKKSGVLGISGVSSDFRDVLAAGEAGNERAKLALEIFYYKVRTQIAAYAGAMGGVDVIVFTAGIGENSSITRREILRGLEFFGFTINDEKNELRGHIQEISNEDSKVKVYVVPTNEELMIARDTAKLVK
ncbi:MAG: acetate/propionate family kinase [Clostridium saudiense]|jgi:acetate kinase|uniref:acetate/propionate family kinase n=1 Tax=Clostridium TaxID=1485 RepID=UPI0004AD84D7|nr:MULTISPECIES: acetate kinase [Clostridium]MBX9184186.1 acetate kinase [Clostridium sp. K04]MDU3520641.1 acetate kinase [Clostridium saudiense]MDU7452897.1 acetate kinase [Clostridium saudiense]MEE0725740.1 acetate kinase [Clostridium saudiense]CUO43855.1 acetate kinase [Clostridium disporicum]